jgi:hypothetical protein
MNTSIYKVIFNKNSDELNYDYERLADYEKERISQLEADSFFDYDDDDGSYVCFIVTNHIEIKAYVSILNNNLISHTVIDLSKSVLNCKVDLDIELKDKVLTTNQIKFNIFMEGINEWILENIDMDTILDRISEVGIKKLRNVEKQFLNNYK